MSLDSQVESFLKDLEALAPAPFETMEPVEARAAAAANARLIGAPLAMAEVRDLEASTTGGGLPLRLYRPRADAVLPAVVYLHGGGWVLGDIPTHEKICTELARGADCAVVSVDYRLAPEHKFPAAAEDAYEALQWVIRQADGLGIDADRVAIAGDSAGGNLATVACLMARDRGSELPIHQTLIYPITDCDFDTPSYHENAEGYLLTRATMQWFWRCYVGSGDEMRHPYASPHRAESLEGLPPALVITAEYDPLRDEGEAYARRLEEFGVPTTLTRYHGMIHAFIRRTDIFDQADAAQQEVCRELRKAFR